MSASARSPERSVCSEVIVGQVRLDDAVEHGDERGAFRMKSLRHLRETDPADVSERVEEVPQWLPGHQPSCPGQRGIGSNGPQRELDRPTALEGGHDLGRQMRAPPRFANLRSDSSNEDEASPASKRHDSRYPLTTCRGSWISISSRRLTGVIDRVFTQAG